MTSCAFQLLAACLAVLLLQTESRANSLHISPDGRKAVIAWPAVSSNYTLQYAPSLAGGGAWSNITQSPVLVGNELVLTNETGPQRFYRLMAPAPSAPSLTSFVAPPSLVFGSNGVINFNFADPDFDIATLVIVRSNALGWRTSSIPARAASILGGDGQINFPLATRDLAFGLNLIEMRLMDAIGNVSANRTFLVNLNGIAGGGSSTPSLSPVTITPSSTRLPTGPKDSVRISASFNYSDTGADIERLRVKLTDPSGRVSGREIPASALGIAGTSGSFSGPILTIRSTNEPGSYGVEFRLIDRAGNVSSPLGSGFFLALGGGADPLSVQSFNPPSGPPGTTLWIYGQGFDGTHLASNRVTIAGVPAEVVDGWNTYLSVLVPSNILTGNIRVETGASVAYSSSQFIVPGTLTLTPTNNVVAVGGKIQFDASLAATGATPLAWSVNGITGGNATVGTISGDGLYTAPSAIPAGEIVTIGVMQIANPSVTAQATVLITTPPMKPGRAVVLAATGGKSRSADGAAGVAIPAGALSNNTEIVVRSLRGTNTPPYPPGMQLLGAAEFGPPGLTFGSPVTITLPLARHLTPGTPLSLLLYNPTNGVFTDDNINATVSKNGDEAVAQVSHFSIWTVAMPWITPPPTPPVVTNITPAGGFEGMKVPVLFSGSDLTYDLAVEVLESGVPTGDIVAGPLYAGTNQAGVLLHIQTITNLGNGGWRDYTLRLRRGNTEVYTDVIFTVDGLDELILPAGQTLTLTNPPPAQYSEIHIHSNATLRVASGALDIQSTGPVVVDGRILNEGTSGQSGANQNGGAGAGGPTPGGHGGQGRDDNGCDSDASFDCAPFAAYGTDGNLVMDNAGRMYGQRGFPGGNADLGFVDILLDVVSCLGGNLRSCLEAVVGIIELVDEINDFEEGWTIGKPGENGVYCDLPGVPAPGFGNSGGGGGGGGVIELDFLTDPDGGGGGGGGGGGRPISIATASDLQVNGLISSKGGNGGDGGVSLDSTWVPFLGDIYGCGGGGGGAGSGGKMQLTIGGSMTVGDDGWFTASGGAAGRRTLISDTSGRVVKLRRAYHDRAPGGRELVTEPGRARVGAGAIFAAPASYLDADTKVTASGLVRARLFNGTSLRVIHNGTTNDVSGQPEPTPYLYAVTPFRVQTILQQGFNTLLIPGMHGLLQKTILVLPGADSDGDGLADPDEIILGSNPSAQDTDGDGLNDFNEATFGSDPTLTDTDGDGLGDLAEFTNNTIPINPDTDGDGAGDGAEVLLNSDPNRAASVPGAIPHTVILGASSGATAPGSVTVIDPVSGAYGLLKQANGGLGFGLELDSMPRVYAACLNSFELHHHYRGSNTPVGNFGFGIRALTLAYNPLNDSFYGAECDALGVPTGQLLGINADTGVATRLGAPLAAAIRGLAFYPGGALFAVLGNGAASDQLAQLNPGDGTIVTNIGLLGFTNTGGLTITVNGSAFASLPSGTNFSRILSVNLTNGAAGALSSLPRDVFDLASPAFGAWSGIVTLTADGSQGVGGEAAALSPDGRWVSFTASSDLLTTQPPPNTNSFGPKSYRRDLLLAETKAALLTLAGETPLNEGYAGPISDDGRFLVSSTPGYTPAAELTGLTELSQVNPGHAFRRDFNSMTNAPVNVNRFGTALSEDRPWVTDISSDGRWVAFSTLQDSNLVTEISLHGEDVYLRDMSAGTNCLVSIATNGTHTGNGGSHNARISDDGRYVFFDSMANNLVTNAGTPFHDFYVRDMQAGTTTLITRNIDGSGAAGYGLKYELYNITPDGRFAVYETAASLLTPTPDNNNEADVFVYDRVTGVNTLISTNLAGEAAGTRLSYAGDEIEEGATACSISADGRYVVFQSQATNMVTVPDTNELHDVFLHDSVTGEIRQLSVSTNGEAGNGASFNPVISADGRRVAFWSRATDLANLTDNNGGADAFLYDVATSNLVCITHNRQQTATGNEGGLGRLFINSNATVVVFSSPATNIIRMNTGSQVFFRRYAP